MPVSVCGTGRLIVLERLFAAMTSNSFRIKPSALRHGDIQRPDCSVHGVLLDSTFETGEGILTLCPSTAPFGLVLGPG